MTGERVGVQFRLAAPSAAARGRALVGRLAGRWVGRQVGRRVGRRVGWGATGWGGGLGSCLDAELRRTPRLGMEPATLGHPMPRDGKVVLCAGTAKPGIVFGGGR